MKLNQPTKKASIFYLIIFVVVTLLVFGTIFAYQEKQRGETLQKDMTTLTDMLDVSGYGDRPVLDLCDSRSANYGFEENTCVVGAEGGGYLGLFQSESSRALYITEETDLFTDTIKASTLFKLVDEKLNDAQNPLSYDYRATYEHIATKSECIFISKYDSKEDSLHQTFYCDNTPRFNRVFKD